MGLRNLAVRVVKMADRITKDLQPVVTVQHLLSTSGSGKKTYLDPVDVPAVISWKQTQVRTPTGVLSVSRAVITFTDVKALEDATGGDGLDDDDRLTLPDGTTGPILDMGGFIDRGTGRPFATKVFLG